jgi:hypothetical protein
MPYNFPSHPDLSQVTGEVIGAAFTEYDSGCLSKAVICRAPVVYLDMTTGEFVAVPAEDSTGLHKELDLWHDAICQLHASAEVVQAIGEALSGLLRDRKASDEDAAALTEQEAEPHKRYLTELHADALTWHDETRTRLREHMIELDVEAYAVDAVDPPPVDASRDPYEGKYLHDSANGLMELMLVHDGRPQRRQNKDAVAGRRKAITEELKRVGWTRTDGKLLYQYPKGRFAFATMKETMRQHWEPKDVIAYMGRRKAKPVWKRVKDSPGTTVRWREVIERKGPGMGSLHPDKLKAYVRENVGVSTIAQVLGAPELSIEGEGRANLRRFAWLDPVNNFIDGLNTHREGELAGGIPYDISREAQLMRYSYGMSLKEYDVDWRHRRKVKLRTEGHAEIDFGSARADFHAYFPDPDGWLWRDRDLHGEEHDLFAIRFLAEAGVSGMCGVSMALESAIAIQEGKGGKGLAIKGQQGPAKTSQRKPRRRVVSDDEPGVQLDAHLKLFAGARADAELKGALEWRDPSTPDKGFVALASAAASVGLMAGAARELKFQIDVLKSGVFRLNCHVSLCAGLGGSGGVAFEIDGMQVASFIRCVFFRLAYVKYQNLGYFTDEAYKTLQYGAFLAVQSRTSVAEQWHKGAKAVSDEVDEVSRRLNDASARRMLAEETLRECRAIQASRVMHMSCSAGGTFLPELVCSEALEYSLPETRGMLIYQLSREDRFSDAIAGEGSIGDGFLKAQREAILALLSLSVTRDEYDNVVQHIHPLGRKAHNAFAEETIKANLERFMGREAILGIDLPFYQSPYLDELRQLRRGLDLSDAKVADTWMQAQASWFQRWSTDLRGELMDRLPRGYPLPTVTELATYRGLSRAPDHPLFDTKYHWALYQDRA